MVRKVLGDVMNGLSICAYRSAVLLK